MKPEERLLTRSGHTCELCKSGGPLSIYDVPFAMGNDDENSIVLCNTCLMQVEKKAEPDSKHLECLKESMWSEVAGVQVVSWRMLNRLRDQSWAADCLEMMYMEEDRLQWARSTGDHENDASVDLHRDCNGQVLTNGDTIVLIKSLDVKGTSLNAKMGTVVKNIRLVNDNTEQIEGKIEGQLIVILTKYVRKQ